MLCDPGKGACYSVLRQAHSTLRVVPPPSLDQSGLDPTVKVQGRVEVGLFRQPLGTLYRPLTSSCPALPDLLRTGILL